VDKKQFTILHGDKVLLETDDRVEAVLAFARAWDNTEGVAPTFNDNTIKHPVGRMRRGRRVLRRKTEVEDG
jgi:hypothetical protein